MVFLRSSVPGYNASEPGKWIGSVFPESKYFREFFGRIRKIAGRILLNLFQRRSFGGGGFYQMEIRRKNRGIAFDRTGKQNAFYMVLPTDFCNFGTGLLRKTIRQKKNDYFFSSAGFCPGFCCPAASASALFTVI